MIGYFKKDNKKDVVPVMEETANEDVLDCSVESIDLTPCYYSVTQDPCEPYIDQIVTALEDRFIDVGMLRIAELPVDFDKTSRMDFDAAYAKSEMVSERVNTLLDNHFRNEYYKLYKKHAIGDVEYSVHDKIGHRVPDVNRLNKFLKTVNVLKSEMLREVLVNNGVTNEESVRYMCEYSWSVFSKRYEIEKTLNTVLSYMKNVREEYVAIRKLSKELDLIGREYKNISRLDLNGVFGNVPDGVLPVVNVVITETGVHLCWDIRLDSKCDLKITSDGMLMYPVGSDWLALKGYYAIHRKMSYLMGNVSSLIKQKIGKSVKVTSVGLANNNVKEIMNYSNRKVINLNTLYDAVYDDADRGELSDDEIEEVYNLLASLNTYDNTVEMLEVSDAMFDTWEETLKFLDNAIEARVLINEVLRGDVVR